ncbi:MAG: hypothetical protein R6U32_07060 [Candidatus Woesearchaeota archaeon]
MTKNGTFLARQKPFVSEHFQIQKLACQSEECKTPPFRAEILKMQGILSPANPKGFAVALSGEFLLS